MSAAHTPGPWVAYNPTVSNNYWAVGLENKYGNHGVRCDGDVSEYMHISGICSSQDARLIAAAPELLEALETLEAALIRDMGAGYAGVALCQAAIAKARGQA